MRTFGICKLAPKMDEQYKGQKLKEQSSTKH